MRGRERRGEGRRDGAGKEEEVKRERGKGER